MKYNILSIIEPREVLNIAFADVGSVPIQMSGLANIEYAIRRFVEPVMGAELLEVVSRGEYEYLRINYVQAAIAFYVRYISGYDDETNGKQILERARYYLRELSKFLREHEDDYAEYESGRDVLNRCRIYGDLVQVL